MPLKFPLLLLQSFEEMAKGNYVAWLLVRSFSLWPQHCQSCHITFSVLFPNQPTPAPNLSQVYECLCLACVPSFSFSDLFYTSSSPLCSSCLFSLHQAPYSIREDPEVSSDWTISWNCQTRKMVNILIFSALSNRLRHSWMQCFRTQTLCKNWLSVTSPLFLAFPPQHFSFCVFCCMHFFLGK